MFWSTKNKILVLNLAKLKQKKIVHKKKKNIFSFHHFFLVYQSKHNLMSNFLAVQDFIRHQTNGQFFPLNIFFILYRSAFLGPGLVKHCG